MTPRDGVLVLAETPIAHSDGPSPDGLGTSHRRPHGRNLPVAHDPPGRGPAALVTFLPAAGWWRAAS